MYLITDKNKQFSKTLSYDTRKAAFVQLHQVLRGKAGGWGTVLVLLPSPINIHVHWT